MTRPRAEIVRVRELVNAILDEGPTPERLAELAGLLDHDPEACEVYLDFITTHAHLQRQLGGEVLQVPGLPAVVGPAPRSPRRISMRRHGIAAALLIVGVFVGICVASWHSRKAASPAYVATLAKAVDAQWSAATSSLEQGSLLKQGPLVLTNGLAEIELFDGTILTLEGPTSLELVGTNRIALQEGMLVAEVPPPATGFEVETQAAQIVDLGTSVGVRVDAEGTAWVRAFDGVVRVSSNGLPGGSQLLQKDEALSADGKTVAAQSIQDAALQFPRPAHSFEPDVHGDFELNDEVLTDGIPRQAGYWSGDTCSIVGAEQGIAPHSGQGMLKFIATTAPEDRPEGITGASQQWRIIELNDIRDQVRAGDSTLEASVYFNQVADRTEPTDVVQCLSVHVFKGHPGEPDPFSRHIRSLNAEINTDNDPQTWERAELIFNIPPDADYLALELRTAIDISSGIQIRQFEGHYADSLSLTLRVGPIPAKVN